MSNVGGQSVEGSFKFRVSSCKLVGYGSASLFEFLDGGLVGETAQVEVGQLLGEFGRASVWEALEAREVLARDEGMKADR